MAGEMGQMGNRNVQHVGQWIQGEQIVVAVSLCSSASELGQDRYVENIEADHHKHNSQIIQTFSYQD